MVLNPWGTPPPPNSLEAYEPVYLAKKKESWEPGTDKRKN